MKVRLSRFRDARSTKFVQMVSLVDDFWPYYSTVELLL